MLKICEILKIDVARRMWKQVDLVKRFPTHTHDDDDDGKRRRDDDADRPGRRAAGVGDVVLKEYGLFFRR